MIWLSLILYLSLGALLLSFLAWRRPFTSVLESLLVVWAWLPLVLISLALPTWQTLRWNMLAVQGPLPKKQK